MAGKPISTEPGYTLFDKVGSAADQLGGECGLFASQQEWELARWIAMNIGHGKADELLKLDIVSSYMLSGQK